MRTIRRALVAALLAGAAIAAVAGLALALGEGSTREAVAPPPPVSRPDDGRYPMLVAAGDIAYCNRDEDERSARLLERRPRATIALLGDIAYPDGREVLFERCYDASWGRYKERTRPAPGNHEYLYFHKDANAYFLHFGARAGEWGEGYYSYDVGSWHVIVLNSNCGAEVLRGCGGDSPQGRWLRNDLARNRARCTLAYWHHPRFSAGGQHGSQAFVQTFWDALYEAGADVVLGAHDHNYQRFAPQTPAGQADPARGIRQFVVGTGGAPLHPLGKTIANLERQAAVHGVLELRLRPNGYDWEFVPVPGARFRDSGSGRCH